MRPSASSFSSVIRAISRRTPSKPERTTAFGVSSMMKSTPVRFSSARMLRPSRPMMRPFMSSEASCTTDDRRLGRVAGGDPLHADGEDVAHAAVGVALGLLLDLADQLAPSRGGPGPRAPSAAAASPARRVTPATRSSWRSRSRCSSASSPAWRSSASARSSIPRSRRATSARWASSVSSLPRTRSSMRTSSARRALSSASAAAPARRRLRRARRAARRWALASVEHGGQHEPHCQQRRRDHDLHWCSSSSARRGSRAVHDPFG